METGARVAGRVRAAVGRPRRGRTVLVCLLLALPPTAAAVPAHAETPPAAPHATATPNLHSVRLEWGGFDSAADPPVTGYEVYRGSTAEDLSPYRALPAEADSFNYFTDFGATPGTRYYYAVAATNGSVEGPRSEVVDAVAADSGVLITSDRWTGTADLDIAVLDAGGQVSRLTENGGDHETPAASPDAGTVAYTADTGHPGDYDLWVHPLGGAPRPLVADPAYDDGEPAYSPDGTRIAFTRIPQGGGAPSVWIVPAAGGTPRRIPGSVADSEPSWSPNGRVLAVTNRTTYSRVDVIAPDGRVRRTFAGGESYRSARNGTFSPDGRFLSYLADTAQGAALVYVRTDGANTLGVTDPANFQVFSQRWSVGGGRIVYHGKTTNGPEGLYTFVPATLSSRQLQVFDGGHFGQPVDALARAPYAPQPALPAPKSFTVGSLARTAVGLAWANVGNTFWYEVRRSAPGGPAPATPDEGTAVYAGTGLTATMGGLTAGKKYAVSVFAMNLLGEPGPARSLTVVPVGPPTVDPAGTASAVDSTTASFPATWGPALPAGQTYEVQYGTRSSPTAAPTYKGFYSGTATKGTIAGAAGKTYYLRARVRQGAAATGWSVAAAAPVPYDDRALTTSGKWKNLSGQKGRFLGTLRTSGVAGASLTLRQYGSTYALIADRCPTCGKVKVYVDGRLKATVDTVAKATAVRQVVWSTTFGSIGRHTVKLVVVGTKGRPNVRVDGLAARR